MSGIRNFTKQSITIASIAICILSFSAIAGAEKGTEKRIEKTVKVSVGKTNNVEQELVSVASNSKSTLKLSTVKQDSSGEALKEKSQLSSERKSSYKDVSDPALMVKQSEGNKEINTKAKSKIRDVTLSNSSNSGHIYFYSVAVDMNYDDDGDGYYSDFTVSFDADTTYNYVTVYASLYVSLNGGDWEHYYTTDNFELDGTSSSDIYQVRTQLTSGFPPGSYDILIDLYDAYDDSLVATISADTEYELAEHYLEDITYEYSTTSEFSIFSASLNLLTDDDNDGFYQSFSLQFDADVSSGEAYVYAEIWVRDSSGNWERDFVTDDFLLEGNSTLDTYILETIWESGYSTGYYDFRVEIYDADSLVLVATSESFDYELGAVPLEDATLDTVASSGGTGSTTGGNTISLSHGSGGGGGSFGFALIFLILAYSVKRTMMVKVDSKS